MDRQVENALLKRALGYEYDEITTEWQRNQESYKAGRARCHGADLLVKEPETGSMER